MTATDQTADEMLGTLNGFDELAIAKQFGQPIQRLIPDPEKGREGPSPWLYFRALAFVHIRRTGIKDAEAYGQAMELSVTASQEYFAAPSPDLDPDDPDTEAGKDSSPSD